MLVLTMLLKAIKRSVGGKSVDEATGGPLNACCRIQLSMNYDSASIPQVQSSDSTRRPASHWKVVARPLQAKHTKLDLMDRPRLYPR